jgi:acylphosphatase
MHGEKQTKRYFVSGMVQGVGFRMFVAREANKLGISGYTRNLFDGRVEVLAHGTRVQLEQLRAALERGPLLSSVSGVREEEAHIDAHHQHGFVIEPSN